MTEPDSNIKPSMTLTLDPEAAISPLIKSHENHHHPPSALPAALKHHVHPSAPPPTQTATLDPTLTSPYDAASLFFVGTATVILEWAGLRIMTDPNFLHAGDHVHLGPGVTATRVTNPAVDLEQLPPVHAVLLSHFHADHFDQKVQENLRRDMPIVTTPHAVESLEPLGFSRLFGLETWQSLVIEVRAASSAKTESTSPASIPSLKITSTPGEHVAGPIVSTLNDFLGAVPPVSGWMVELYKGGADNGKPYRIYISGDTLFIDKLKEIPQRYPDVDLLLIHLGGTTIPGPHLPLLMVTMNGTQGLQLVKLIKPKLTLPIHYDDYDVFLSPLSDFQKEMAASSRNESGDGEMDEGGYEAIWWERGERFDFGLG